MINAWYLLWIIPAAASFGVLVMAVFVGVNEKNPRRDPGREEGGNNNG